MGSARSHGLTVEMDDQSNHSLRDTQSQLQNSAELQIYPDLQTRQIKMDDIPFVLSYWKNISADERTRMGVVDSISSMLDTIKMSLEVSVENLSRESHEGGDCEIWLLNGTPIGFSTLKNLRASESGEMHLHMAAASFRGKGFGRTLFCKSAIAFFKRWHLKRLICEPRSENPMPNRMLQKAGFLIIGSRFGASSSLSMQVNLNTYLIRHDIVSSWLAVGNQIPNKCSSFSVSAAENGPHILNELQKQFNQAACVLEFGSRTGQHAHLFTRVMPHLLWQPTDQDEENLASVRNLFATRNTNRQILPPLAINLETENWAKELPHLYDLLYSSNVIHAASEKAARNIFFGARDCLKPGGKIWFYGPFVFSGEYSSPSNKVFDDFVKTWNTPHTGLRDTDELDAHAKEFGFKMEEKIEMPVNNHILVYSRK
jgi:RimJ/RimL family protein N-acetyltransferase